MTPYFDSLPDEIISSIILLLPVVDILSCRVLFVRLNAIIQNDATIQYKIELAASGFVACPDSTLPTATSLRMLREQQDAWRRCEWKEDQVQVAQLRGGECPYKCRNGVLAVGRNGLPPSPTGLLSDNATGITCLKVASATTCKGAEEASQWHLDGLGVAFRDFAIDPLVDLLVLAERNTNNISRFIFPFRMHILKLSDGQPHEMAAKHMLDLRMKDVSAPQYCGVSIKLHGTYVGVLVQDGNAEDYDSLTIWNWRTGEQELQIEAPMFSYEDFAFIDTHSVMLAVNGYPSALQVWYFDRSNVFHVGSFALPYPTHDYNSIHFDGGPWLSLGDAKTLDGTPFALSPVSEVLAISLEGDPDPSLDEDECSTFTMVMRPSLMFDALGVRPSDRIESFERLCAGCSPNSLAFSAILDWGEWGPQCTRWIPQKFGRGKWDQHLVGGRFAVVTPARPTDSVEPVQLTSSPKVVRLYDFRPEIVARYRRSFPQDICTDVSVIRKGTIFIEDVISRLPYHVVTSQELPHNVSRVMIDNGRLICSKEDPDFHAFILHF